MSQYSAWETWIFGNIPIVILTIVLMFGALGWLFNRLLKQHKEFSEMRDKFNKELKDTETSQIVKEIKRLVDEIKELFRNQKDHETRISNLETRCEGQTTKCDEREKLVTDKFKVLHNRVNDIRIDGQLGGKRSYDPPTDRCERTD